MASDVDHTRVFLSYSRQDEDFAVWLARRLGELQCICDFDRSVEDPDNVITGIAAEDIWWLRLQEMITGAEVVIFVVSPASIRSRVCDEEIAFAQGLGKRIIPILCRPIDFAKAPPRLSALNVKISFPTVGGESRDSSARQLASAIRRDVRWFRAASRIAIAATRWEALAHANDGLLRGTELRQAEDWAARRPSTAPEHPKLVLDYISASRAAEAERMTIGEIEKARYLELLGIMRPFLEEELRIREAMPKPDHFGVQEENRLEIEYVRSLLSLQNNWHPRAAVHLETTGAIQGYAIIFQFPCCSTIVRDFRSSGEDDLPSQFRADGCQKVPETIQHEYKERPNPFSSALIRKFQQIQRGDQNEDGQ